MKEEDKYIDSYEKLPVGKFMELQEIVNDEEADAVDKNIAIVSILTDIDPVELYNMPIARFGELMAYTDFLQNPLLNVPVENKYKVCDWVLVPTVDFSKMTTAQFIDYQSYIKEANKNLVEILTVFLIPEGHNYNDGYDMARLQNDIREHMNITEASSLSGFFLLLWKSLSKAILHSLVKKMKKEMKTMTPEQRKKLDQKIQGLAQNGDGLSA